MLLGDSKRGIIFIYNVEIKFHSVLLDHPLMRPAGNDSLGIDGLQVFNNTVYFTNPSKKIFAYVQLTEGGRIVGDVEVLLTGVEFDDFIVDEKGAFYFADFFNNAVVRLGPGKKNTTVIAVSSLLDHLTACKFGRADGNLLDLFCITTEGLGIADVTLYRGGTLTSIKVEN